MRFQSPLVPARLLRRYKRFLADAVLESDGREVTAHCANPGAMTGLAEPGTRIWLEPNDDPRRKLRFAWRLAEPAGGGLACVDTAAANRVMKEALADAAAEGLEAAAAGGFRAEVAMGERSRVDFLLTDAAGRPTWLEVKSVTLCRRSGLVEFPDTVTARGTRHLRELAALAAAGQGAAVALIAMRTDARRAGIAADIDPGFARAVQAARRAGVVFRAWSTRIGHAGITLGTQLPLQF